MSTKEYYERYWRNELPQDIQFFGGKPKPGDAEGNAAVIQKFCKPKELIMDLGCGEGYLVDLLWRLGYQAVGVDISQTAVEIAAKKFQWPFGGMEIEWNRQFDAIVSFDVWEHVFDFDETYAYVNKYLKVGGKLIVTTNDMCLTKMMIIGLFFMDTFFHPYSPHIRFFTKKSLRKLMEAHGYKVIHTERRGNYCGVLSTGQTVVAERIR